MLIVAFGVTVLVFFALRLIPGDPAANILGDRATDARIANLRHNLGLDQPVWTQYLLFVGRIARGDLGQSLLHRLPVLDLIADRLPTTILLVLYAVTLSVAFSVPVAVVCAVKRDRLVDHLFRTMSLIGLAMPSFWIGIVMVLVFSIQLKMFPVSGFGEDLPQHIWHLTLPAVTISLTLTTMLTRSLRSAMLQIMSELYVSTARAKGLPPRVVMVKHILRNALISMVTILGVNVSWLLGGSVVVETVFALPGLGSLMLKAIYARDYQLVQGITLVYSLLVIALNWLVDILYANLDPKVSYG